MFFTKKEFNSKSINEIVDLIEDYNRQSKYDKIKVLDFNEEYVKASYKPKFDIDFELFVEMYYLKDRSKEEQYIEKEYNRGEENNDLLRQCLMTTEELENYRSSDMSFRMTSPILSSLPVRNKETNECVNVKCLAF